MTTAKKRLDGSAETARDPGVRRDWDQALRYVTQLASASTNAASSNYELLYSSLYAEFQQICHEIKNMRIAIASLQAHDLKNKRLPTVGGELDAIVEAVEEATNTIMESAEGIMAADPQDQNHVEQISDHVIKIFEACSFQDITGQRVSKVVETLRHIERRVSRFAEAVGMEEMELKPCEEEEAREKRRGDLLLHGPQRKGEGIEQHAVDSLFADPNAGED